LKLAETIETKNEDSKNIIGLSVDIQLFTVNVFVVAIFYFKIGKYDFVFFAIFTESSTGLTIR